MYSDLADEKNKEIDKNSSYFNNKQKSNSIIQQSVLQLLFRHVVNF
jgi:hypothetical protein